MIFRIGTKFRVRRVIENYYDCMYGGGQREYYVLEKATGVKTSWFFKPKTVWTQIAHDDDPDKLRNDVVRLNAEYEQFQAKSKALREIEEAKKYRYAEPFEFIIFSEGPGFEPQDELTDGYT